MINLIIVLLFLFCAVFVGVDLKKIDECIGDTEANIDNAVLKAEQDSQVTHTQTTPLRFYFEPLDTSMFSWAPITTVVESIENM